ncbi:hypothetical protein [Pseudomonas sp. PS02290]|uniref:hypothetical protein n=1 Tax=Pseudomonas sp. PS02290 TaxID=2991430 RepID=UPI00249BF06E|nr:hypothetical protein [Pseudomonas sp. PS02290]
MSDAPVIKDSSGNVMQGHPSWKGEPPGGGGGSELEARVAALEKTSQDIREKLVRVETKLEALEKTTATKVDIADLKTSIADGFTSQTKWFISTAIALAVIAFTAAKFIHA